MRDLQLVIIILGLINVLNLSLVAVLWFALKRRNTNSTLAASVLKPEVVKQLEEKAIKQLEWRVASAIRDFDASLSQTAGQLNQKLASLIANVIEHEMSAYKDELEKARTQAINSLGQVQSAADELQSKQRAAVAAEAEKEKQRLAAKMDQKLADVISTYLIESLGKEVDLGAQGKYLLATLDKNKKKLKEDILSEY